MEYTMEDYVCSAEYLRDVLPEIPQTAIVLGSGLGAFPQKMECTAAIPYESIPSFPKPTVASHAGMLYCGTAAGTPLLALSGRCHFYEGVPMGQTAYYVRVLKLLGVRNLILTNAAGAINMQYQPGEFMCISDHIKFFSDSPARGTNLEAFGPRFFDMAQVYTPELRMLALKAAEKQKMKMHQGVYAFMSGPQYETPAEIRMLQILGADAVGMSTVPEAIAAAQCGLRVLGISLLSNMAAGMSAQPLSHNEVMSASSSASDRFAALIMEVLGAISA